MSNVIDLQHYRQILADRYEYETMIAEDYEAIYHQPPEINDPDDDASSGSVLDPR